MQQATRVYNAKIVLRFFGDRFQDSFKVKLPFLFVNLFLEWAHFLSYDLSGFVKVTSNKVQIWIINNKNDNNNNVATATTPANASANNKENSKHDIDNNNDQYGYGDDDQGIIIMIIAMVICW